MKTLEQILCMTLATMLALLATGFYILMLALTLAVCFAPVVIAVKLLMWIF